MPSYIGTQIAEIILDIGTMIRFYRKNGLESYVVPKNEEIKGFKLSEEAKNKQYSENDGRMQEEGKSSPEKSELKIDEISISVINPLENFCRL